MSYAPTALARAVKSNVISPPASAASHRSSVSVTRIIDFEPHFTCPAQCRAADTPPHGFEPRSEARVMRMFELDLLDTTLQAAASWLVTQASGGIATRVAFVNAHCVNVSYSNASYRRALSTADCLLADGSGLAIAARAQGTRLANNLNGTDLFPLLCASAAAANVGIFMFGGRPGIAASAAERMQRDNPDLDIRGFHPGYLDGPEAEDRLIEAINASGAKILLAGLGVPLQDLWLARNQHRLAPSVIIGVGGLFDYYSGRIPRAPKALRAFGLEWCWRLGIEPRRLASRYLLGNLEFLVRLGRMRVAAALQPVLPTEQPLPASATLRLIRAR